MDLTEQTLKSLEYDKVLELLAGCSKIKQSKELCYSLRPTDNRKLIEDSLQFTDEARRILDYAMDIPLDFVIDIKNVRLNVEYFSETELIDFAKTLRTSRLVKSFLRENAESDSLLNGLACNLFVDKELEDRVSDTFDENYEVRQTMKSVRMPLRH